MRCAWDEFSNEGGCYFHGEQRGSCKQVSFDEPGVCEQLKALADEDVVRLTNGSSRCLLGVVAYAPRVATRLRLRIAGAQIADGPSNKVTHAVMPGAAAHDGKCAEVRSALSKARVAAAEETGESGVAAWLVDESWLAACEKEGVRVDESLYAIREGRA